MKYLFYVIAFGVFFICSCTNDNTQTTPPAPTIPSTAIPDPAQPNDSEASDTKYTMLNSSTYATKVGEQYQKNFLSMVSVEQKRLKMKEKGNIIRRDTLYAVKHLPFKDQELYLHNVVLDHGNGHIVNKWSFSIHKNGSMILKEQPISTNPFININLQEMKVGDTELLFVGTKEDGSTEDIRIPYDGKIPDINPELN